MKFVVPDRAKSTVTLYGHARPGKPRVSVSLNVPRNRVLELTAEQVHMFSSSIDEHVAAGTLARLTVAP